MRYKVKAPDESAYQELLVLLKRNVPVYVASKRRKLLSTGDLWPSLREEITALGGRITVDHRYDLEGYSA